MVTSLSQKKCLSLRNDDFSPQSRFETPVCRCGHEIPKGFGCQTIARRQDASILNVRTGTAALVRRSVGLVRWHARVALAVILSAGLMAHGQILPESSSAEDRTLQSSMRSLGADVHRKVEKEIEERNYAGAERLLLDEIRQHPDSPELLDILGWVFFLHGKYLNSAIAYKKEESLKPLSAHSRFELAMAYIVMGHRDWARPELEKLARENPGEALYPYWLSRVDYDAQRFEEAITETEASIKLDQRNARAHDSLGLCYEALGRFDDAIKEYQKAAGLEREKHSPSPWPDLNMGALLVSLGRLDEAEKALKEALQFDPKFPKAHYELGLLCEKHGNNTAAIEELQKAAQFDPSAEEPFYALGRIYQRIGERQKAQSAYDKFQQLKEEKAKKGSVTH